LPVLVEATEPPTADMQDEVLMSKMEAAEFGLEVLLLANLLHDP